MYICSRQSQRVFKTRWWLLLTYYQVYCLQVSTCYHWYQPQNATTPCNAINISFLALHQNVANCQNTLTMLTLRWRILLQDVWMCQMSITDAGTTQDNFILPVPPVGGRPISQDWFQNEACSQPHYSNHLAK